VLAWLKKQGAAGKPALAAHAQLQALDQQGDPRATCSSASSTTPAVGAAITLYRLSIERAKPDAEREAASSATCRPSKAA
jgi:hypothetical protein